MDKLHALTLLNDRWPRHLRFGTEFDLDAAVEVLVDAGKVLTTEQIEVTLKEIIRSTTGQRVPVKAITDRFRALVASEKLKQSLSRPQERQWHEPPPSELLPWRRVGKTMVEWIETFDEASEGCTVEWMLASVFDADTATAIMALHAQGRITTSDVGNAGRIGFEVARMRGRSDGPLADEMMR